MPRTVGSALRMLHARHRTAGSIPSAAIPNGVIALWSGTLATIPANWSLCDGTGGTPNLVARFIRGAPAATEPGTTGGADSHTHTDGSTGSHQHTVTNHSHQHTVASAGGHNHGSVASKLASDIYYYESNATTTGAHQHTVSLDTHTHTMDAQGAHTHAISSDDGRPPYYEVAYIQAGVGAQVAPNLVIIYTGTLASIPAGWALCDGGGGRPDLRSRFTRGINTNVTDPGTTGGAATHIHTKGNSAAHSHTEVSNANHSHTFSAYSVAHNHGSLYGLGSDALPAQTSNLNNNFVHTHAASNSIGAHNHNPLGNGGVHTHVVNTASSLPAYYDVAFIINTGATTIPSSGILLWAGLLANIPTGYDLCDGGGGRPDLRAKFVRGSNAGVDPGGTDGSDTHSHTDVAAGAHNDHLETSAGTHQHAATDSIGAHTHGTDPITFLADTAKPQNTDTSAGNHSHTYSNEDSHTHGLVASADHQHTWDGGLTIDGRPAYYEVAFLYKA